MQIILANRYFFPDESATSRIATSLAQGIAQGPAGRPAAAAIDGVHILASRGVHNDASHTLPPDGEIGAVRIHRLPTTRFGRDRLIGRMLDYATFHMSVFTALLKHVRRGDVAIICTDPPMLSVTAMAAVRLKGGIMVNWILDLFPEIAMDLGVLGREGLTTRAALWLRDLSLKAAHRNVVPIARMAMHLADRGIPVSSLAIIHHWSDGEAIRPIAPGEGALRQEWGLTGKCVVGYSGNLGRAHEFDTVLATAERLKTRDDIVFLFVGGGYRRAAVEAEAARRGLANVMFKPLQPRERLAECLGLPDVHLVSLLPPMEPYIVPSKFYGIAAAGRPTLFVGDTDGEIARALARAQCGASVAIGDVDGLARAVLDLAQSPERRREWGANARQVYDEHFSETRGIAEWRQLIDTLAPARTDVGAPTLSRGMPT
ncbi:glycosyltransferase family 4 protein [Chelatococcus asaccharovorans]|uniref:Glycosyltransferase involved in cell wall biosynthesis n=1 Tax=Chelatococcus asaccharovorans TaxID=28210 RepID=A0A2V3TWR4_9HYPH|nr:glycosyltransferase family 4 protein [Chelatococcus asaccharovorans]MBS7702142.1 glycosyltransferase family 4 protein [Chelatococcus asaccharovorans]PXW52911.1 glycosyltransferase involved in cell wall biosynthesis [Chelatococcus asaccharovorans]